MPIVVKLRAVIFDWRGTLVVTPSDVEWCRLALASVGRPAHLASAQELLSQIEGAPSSERLSAHGVDASIAVHRDAYFSVFADAGLDSGLAEALYAIESDAALNPFADDVAETLEDLKSLGLKVAILSDIHFDIRPAFADASLLSLVDAFVLSFERGLMKPDPAFFAECLRDLNLNAAEALMVGDRATHDGEAVQVGCPVLLLPPLASTSDRRLHLVTSLLRSNLGRQL